MFTLNSDTRKIIKKLSLLIGIFILVNYAFIIYLENFSIAYRPLKRKSQVLYQLYPDPKIIIGGDSIAETGIDPNIISPKNGINIASPASGIQGFRKALHNYHQSALDNSNMLIVNVSTLNFNDDVIGNDHFIGQIDGFLEAGIPYLAKQWKKKFFENLFNVYRCTFPTCPYLAEQSYPELEKSTHRGFIPLVFTDGKRTSLEERKKLLLNYESYYKNLTLEGVLFNGFKRDLAFLAQSPAKIFIVFLPPMSALKSYLDSTPTSKKLQNFITHVKSECEQYSNCYFLDYYNWDHSQMSGSDEDNYYDLIHFTHKGGETFSTILKHDIDLKIKRI